MKNNVLQVLFTQFYYIQITNIHAKNTLLSELFITSSKQHISLL